MGVYCAASMTFGRPELAPQVRLDQTAPMNAVDFASLLCSRLCHDLMSPVGALNNGIELMADEQDPEMRERCVDLLADSARATANKLKFFRLAFGAGGGFADLIDANEAKVALEGIFGAERRIELGWMVAPEKLSKGAMKLLLNLALIAGDDRSRPGNRDPGRGAEGGARRGLARNADQWRSAGRTDRAEGGRSLARKRACERVRRKHSFVGAGARGADNRGGRSPKLTGRSGLRHLRTGLTRL